MGLFELLLVSVGLAMDAFAVSVCGSMVLSPENRFQGAMRFGIWFGAFQALMPLLGYLGAVSFQTYIVDYDHWIAFALLAYLGWFLYYILYNVSIGTSCQCGKWDTPFKWCDIIPW